MATKSVETSSQFKMLPRHIQELIQQDMLANGSADNGATPFSFAMSPSAEMTAAVQGTVFKDDATEYKGAVGPLTRADIAQPVAEPAPREEQPAQGALSATMRQRPPREDVDFETMLNKYVPRDDSRSKYLALAAAFTTPTQTGSFGETVNNVANAMLQQKQQQQKLRAQYAPLIMQQIAAQQTREEQNMYRLEAQRQAQIAQQQAALQAQQGRVELANLNQAAANERAKERRALQERMDLRDEALRRDMFGNRPQPAPNFIVGADGTQLMVDRSGQARPVVGPDGVPVKTKTTQSSMSAAMQKELLESDDAVQSSQNVTGLLQQALKLNNDAYSGYAAKGRAVLRSNLPGQSNAADATINLDNIMTGQALESLKSTFGAAPTEGERKILMDIQASADKTPKQREEIITRAIGAAEKRAKYAEKKAQAIREGTYLTQGAAPSAPTAPKTVSWGELK